MTADTTDKEALLARVKAAHEHVTTVTLEARALVDTAVQERAQALLAAKAAGLSWREIGEPLDLTPQRVQQAAKQSQIREGRRATSK